MSTLNSFSKTQSSNRSLRDGADNIEPRYGGQHIGTARNNLVDGHQLNLYHDSSLGELFKFSS